MKIDICLLHIVGYPGTILIFTRRVGAVHDHRFKIMIGSNSEHVSFEYLFHTFTHFYLSRKYYATLMWRIPKDRFTFAVPRKYSIAIGKLKPFFRKISTNS